MGVPAGNAKNIIKLHHKSTSRERTSIEGVNDENLKTSIKLTVFNV